MLFGVDPMDPATFAAIATLVVAIAVLASYVPAPSLADRSHRGVADRLTSDPTPCLAR